MFISEQFILEKTQLQIYCDMDGVLCDFDARLSGINPNLVDAPDPVLWKVIYKIGPKYWSKMNWMPDGKQLWSFILSHNPIILSSPPRTGADRAEKGKREWCKNNLGSNIAKTAIITRIKEKYAGPNMILIDDRKSNISKFKKAGGIGILHTSAKNTIKQLRTIL